MHSRRPESASPAHETNLLPVTWREAAGPSPPVHKGASPRSASDTDAADHAAAGVASVQLSKHVPVAIPLRDTLTGCLGGCCWGGGRDTA